jgi:hypothetical protein
MFNLNVLLEYVVDHIILAVSMCEFLFSIPQNVNHCLLFTLQQNFYRYMRFFII